MKLTGFEIRRVKMPLVAPFTTSFGTQTAREVLIFRAATPEADGWSECVTLLDPVYSPEYVEGALDVMKRFFIPALFAFQESRGGITAAHVGEVLKKFHGHPMAKSTLETAILDAELRIAGISLASYLGSTKTKVPSGVSVGIMNSVPELLDAVDMYVAQGYLRIKLKIQPGWDLAPVAAVRERFGDDLLLQTDANTAYTVGDAAHLAKMDAFNLLLHEQPLPEDDILGHAELAKLIKTPICLDESIVSAKSAADAIRLGACSIINIKPGRVGGYLESRRIHDVAAAHRVPVWAGGMLETGIGRAANIALAGMSNFTLPGDTSASDRYYLQDITAPFVLDNGYIDIPTGPGIGVDPDLEALAAVTSTTEWIPA